MTIKRTEKYKTALLTVLKYIAKDKISASKKFKQSLHKQIKNIPKFPYKHRKSIYFNNENIRDLISKGYTVNYEIDLKNDRIIVFDIFNKNKPPMK